VRNTIVWAYLLGAALTVPAQAESMTKFSKRPYGEVRAALIKEGYRPASLKHDPDDLFCTGRQLCKTYPEVIDCSGTGVSSCTFAFGKANNSGYLVVITYGETKLTVSGVREATAIDLNDIKQRG
jgi:hypothetical protein